MTSRKPDRALRRLVAELASEREEDVEAVLALLDPWQCAAVQALLDDYSGAPAPPAADQPDWRIEGLSPWLLRRLEGEPPGATTAQGLELLRRCAASLRAEPAAATAWPRGQTLLGRVRAWL